MAAFPSFAIVPEQFQGNKVKQEYNETCSESPRPDTKQAATWKSAMAFLSKRLVEGHIESTSEAGSDINLPPSLPSYDSSLGHEPSEPGIWPLMRRWRKHMAQHESEYQGESQSSFSQSSSMQESYLPLLLQSSSDIAEQGPIPKTGTSDESASPLTIFPAPQIGRPLSAHPLLVTCVPETESTPIPPVDKPLSPRQSKRKRRWVSDEKRHKNKRKVMCVSQDDEQMVLDAAVTLSKLSVPAPPKIPRFSNSPKSLVPLTHPPNTVRMALPPPPFRLWQTKR